MSFILESLKKAETERRQGQPDNLDPAAADPRPPQRDRRGPVLLLILALVVNAGLLAWWLKPWAVPPAPAAKVAPFPVPIPPAGTDADDPPPAPPAEREATVAREVSGSSQEEAVSREPAVVQKPANRQEGLVATQEAKPAPETAPVPESASTAGEQAVNPGPAVVPKPVVQSAAASAPTAPAGKPAGERLPAYRDLPPAERARIPEIELQLHYYTAAKERRLVRINGANLHEGEGAGGVRVDEIRPAGMVLESSGVTFFYPASRM